jgi:hypothetical protein
MFATECGDDETNDTRQAVYLLRRVASLWGMGVVPIVYAFADGDAFAVVKATASGVKPRESYLALRALTTIVATLGGPGGHSGTVPHAVANTGLAWPLMTVGLYGKRGSLLLLWQRTYANRLQTWDSLSLPRPGTVSVDVPPGVTVRTIVTPRTGATQAVRLASRTVVVAVGEEPVAIECSAGNE